jgi:hypothetical protein
MIVTVLQAYPTENYKVYLYFSDGKVKLYDILPLTDKGIFKKLQDKDFFLNRCTVLNHTLAWDVNGDYNPSECIDLDSITLYEQSVEVADPLAEKSILESGKNTLAYEITSITSHGFWLFVNDREYFISYTQYPEFLEMTLKQIFNVKSLDLKQFHWEDKDIDIDIDSLSKQETFPLKFES